MNTLTEILTKCLEINIHLSAIIISILAILLSLGVLWALDKWLGE